LSKAALANGDDRYFGLNSRVLESSLGKRFVEVMSGKSNLGGFIFWLDNLDFVPDVPELVNEISSKFTFFDSASRKCSLESLSRPEKFREDEIAAMLGYKCDKCGKVISTLAHRTLKECSCPGRGQFKITYLLVHKQLRALNINPTPEAVLMSVAWDMLAEAYIKGYSAFQKVLASLVKQYGLVNAFQFIDADFKDRLDSIFYYFDPGDMRMAKEERETLMFIVRGNLAGIGLDDATDVIRAAIDVCKYGYMSNKLFCAGADSVYDSVRMVFSVLYNPMNERIRRALIVTREERARRTVEYLKIVKDGKEVIQYFPFYQLDNRYWSSGKLSKNLVLKPIDDWPIFTTYKDCAVNLFVAPSGKGKSTCMANNVAYAFDYAHELIFNVLGDESNSLTLASMPLFHCKGRTGSLLKILELTGVKPHPIPTITLTFLREGEEISKDNYEANPPTIYDRVVRIREPWDFGLKFHNKGQAVKDGYESPGVLDELNKIAVSMGYPADCDYGLVNVRNLCRYTTEDDKDGTDADIQIATGLLHKFAGWRENCKEPAARIVADEASYLAPSTYAVAGKDTSKSSGMLTNTIKKVRKKRTSFDLGTQKYSEINTEVKVQAFNVCFRELPQSGDRSRSQRDLVLESLALKEGKSERDLVASVMEKGIFPDDEFFWFHWNQLTKRIQVVKPTVPFFMINQPNMTNREIFRAYENAFDTKILLKSWSEVPVLRYESDAYFRYTPQVA